MKKIESMQWYKQGISLMKESFQTVRNNEDIGHKWFRVDVKRIKGKDVYVIIDANIGSKIYKEKEVEEVGSKIYKEKEVEEDGI